MAPLRYVMSRISNNVRYFSGIAGLIVYSVPAYFRSRQAHPIISSITVNQIYFTGNMALSLIGQVALALGAITILQLFTQLSKVGALDYVGPILNIVIIRELGPVVTAFIVIARSGSAIAAEVGTMKVMDQIEALEMMGIDPLRFLVFPRLAGMVVALLFLTIYFDAIGIIGGYIVGYFTMDLSPEMFMNYVMNAIGIVDVVSGLLKSFIFSLFIATIPIYHGFQATAPTQIPQVTTKAVMSSIVVVFIIDVFITILVYI